jgi:hypothetical protein
MIDAIKIKRGIIIGIDKLKAFIQSDNVNFIFGSGLSKPYLETLGNIEKLLTELVSSSSDENIPSIIKASIYREYFPKTYRAIYNTASAIFGAHCTIRLCFCF